MADVLKPSPQLLIKLGSIIVHYEEFLSKDGHEFDKQTIDAMMKQEDVKEWFDEMSKLALLPAKRKNN